MKKIIRVNIPYSHKACMNFKSKFPTAKFDVPSSITKRGKYQYIITENEYIDRIKEIKDMKITKSRNQHFYNSDIEYFNS